MKISAILFIVSLAAFQATAQAISDVEVFEAVLPTLQQQTSVPLRLPTFLDVENKSYPLYSRVLKATRKSYELQMAFSPDCGDGASCYYGKLTGEKNDDADEIKKHGKSVPLAQGFTGYFSEAVCDVTCTDATMSWLQGGYIYSVGIRSSNVTALTKIANSAINNKTSLTKNDWTRTCFLQVEVTEQNTRSELKRATAAALNRESGKTYKSKWLNDFPLFTRLPEGNYQITVVRSGYQTVQKEFQVRCTAINRELTMFVTLGKGGLINPPKKN